MDEDIVDMSGTDTLTSIQRKDSSSIAPVFQKAMSSSSPSSSLSASKLKSSSSSGVSGSSEGHKEEEHKEREIDADESLVTTSQDPNFMSTHDIILLLDVRENLQGKVSILHFAQLLERAGVTVEQRALCIGDVLFIARRRSDGAEFVLDCIVERKTISDLACSVKDTRLVEQRRRMKTTKARRRIYLIEGAWTENSFEGIDEETLLGLLCRLDAYHGYLVFRSNGQEDTVSFLANMFQELILQYGESQRLLGSFTDFQSKFKKSGNETISLFFGTQLRMIKGVSGNKAWAIISRYPTLPDLMNAYNTCANSTEGELLLSNLEYDHVRVGPACSRKIYTFFNQCGQYPSED